MKTEMTLMRLLPISMLLLAVSSLAACQTTAPQQCAGWKKIPPPNDPAYLAVNEPRLSSGVIAHNQFGEKQGCWE